MFDAEGLSWFFPGSVFDSELFGDIDAGICLFSDGGKREAAHDGELSDGEKSHLVHLLEGIFDKRGSDREISFAEGATGFEGFGADGSRAEGDFADDVSLFHMSTLVGFWRFDDLGLNATRCRIYR